MARKSKELSFEASMAELEQIISEMENGETDLQELINKYSRGIELSQKCLAELDSAEKAMDIMLKEAANDVKEEPLVIS